MIALPRTAALVFLVSACALAQQTNAPQDPELASLSAPQGVQSKQDAERAEQRAKEEMREKIELLSAHSKLVAGKPYSATSTTDTVQTLADGNRILHHSSSVIYRDNQGRTRREQTFAGFDAGPGETKIFIEDPVAKAVYVLDPSEKTARSIANSREVLLKLERSSDTMANVKLPRLDEQHDIVKEDLGQKNIAGVQCTGTRQTITIPAGQIGNERPIAIVTETWFSPALEAVVQSSTNDPRFGQTTYTLANIELKDQPLTLFEPPAGYRLEK